MPVDPPKPGESRDKYLNYCIPIEVGAGKEVSQAAAICNSYYDKDKMSKITNTSEKVMASVAYNTKYGRMNLFAEEDCPEATQNVALNLYNRSIAIKQANYGPLNPNEPNEGYWKAKAAEFEGDIQSAKKALCGNCAFFDVRKQTLDCIAKGIGYNDDPERVIEAGGLGYCEAFDFKCASKRTCSAWVVGGPITMAEVGPRGGIRESPKAPKSDTPNPNPQGEGTAKGKASGKRGAEVSAGDEETLKNKVKDFNERDSNTKNGNATLGVLKSVFQRGLGAYTGGHSPNVSSASQWAFARVNAFLYLLKNGRPQNPKYVNDNDLLPKEHPKYSGK
jgi:hypothetical protein